MFRRAVHDEHLQTDHPRSLALTIVDLARNITASWRSRALTRLQSLTIRVKRRRPRADRDVGPAMQDSMVAAVTTTARITPSQ